MINGGFNKICLLRFFSVPSRHRVGTSLMKKDQKILLWPTSGGEVEEKVKEVFLLVLFSKMPRCHILEWCVLNPISWDDNFLSYWES
jgi:hypothetical protein